MHRDRRWRAIQAKNHFTARTWSADTICANTQLPPAVPSSPPPHLTSSLHLTPLTGPKCRRVLRVGRRKVRVGCGKYFFFYFLVDSVLLGLRSLLLSHLLHLTTNPTRSKILHFKLTILFEEKKPTWCHLLFYFTSYMLNMFRTLIYPPSGACDYSVELPHWSYCSWFDVCWSFGVVGLEWYPCCRLKPVTCCFISLLMCSTYFGH